MIQRIQTVFILLSALCMAACLCMKVAIFESPAMGTESQYMYNMFVTGGENGQNFTVAGLAVLLIAGIILSVLNIFGYKNLKKQSRQCLMTMILIVLWYGGAAILVDTLCPTKSTIHMNYSAVGLPFIALIFQWLAHHYIKHDIKLLKAADRIR